ncbi:MAG: glycosyltransferase family 2 protein [Acidimicrobiia bacterium]
MTIDLHAPPPAGDVDVSAVVVSWNTVDLLAACLASLEEHAASGIAMEVIVVDNGSTDGSAELVAERWPGVRLISNPDNRGYQVANNQGMRAARGSVLLLINADAMLQPGCLSGLLSRLAADDRCAIVGPRLEYGDGSFQRWTAGRLPTLASVAASFLFVDRLLPRWGVWLGRDLRQPAVVGWVSSACLVVRRSALQDIGLMDERFFAYMDDVDLCARAGAAGWRVWYEPGAVATHLMGQSTKRQTGRSSPLAVSTFLRYVELHRGPRVAAGTRIVAAAGFALRALIHGSLGLRSAERRATALGHGRSARICLSTRYFGGAS